MKSRNLKNITGIDELDIKDITEKLGSMADSTKCCASGTCGHYFSKHGRRGAPKIKKSIDQRDAFKIRSELGNLI